MADEQAEGTHYGPSVACGLDVVELSTIAEAIAVADETFLQNIYTKRELTVCRNRLPRLAAWFAAKEAVSKALGTGFEGFCWLDIEILLNGDGQPQVQLSGPAALRAANLNLTNWSVAISSSRTSAIACVLAYSENLQCH